MWSPLDNNNNSFFDPLTQMNDNHSQKCHLRYQQRNGRKCYTLIEGLTNQTLPDNLTPEKLLKRLKKKFSCNGTLQKQQQQQKQEQKQQNKKQQNNKENQSVLVLNGDHRLALKKYLIDNNIFTSNNIIVHGFN